MFEVKKHKTIVKDLHKIVHNFHSILNDGDNDILYTGTNIYGNRILGSIVFEDDDTEFLRYFHILITDTVYNSFINRHITLRQILKNAEGFFVVDKKYNGYEIEFNIASFDDIPNEYLPLENSLCPELLKEASLEYSFSLKGGISDLHKVDPDVMSAVNIQFCSFLKSSSEFVKKLRITPVVYSEVALAGSFELNFRIEFKEVRDLFYVPSDDVKNFLPKLYNYIIDVLPKEKDGVLKEENIESESFKKLENELRSIYAARLLPPNIDVEQNVIDLITYSVEKLKDIEYKGFDKIELINNISENEKVPIALINHDFYNSVESKIFKPEELNKEDIIDYDENPTEYSIQVYALNKETGNGAAYLSINNGVKKIPLHLRGRKDYHDTVFTKNIDEERFINIKSIAKRVNGDIKEITFNF